MASRCYENFPTSLLQGMALGIPAIVPIGGPMPDIVGDSGVAFENGELAKTLDSLFYDKERLAQCRMAALQRIDEFTPEKYWKLYSNIFK